MRKNTDNAAFFSANSCQKPKFFGNDKEGKEAELNYKLGTQLPYIFVVSRLAHYIKVIQRENIGTWKSVATWSPNSTPGFASTWPTWTTPPPVCAAVAHCVRRRLPSATSKAIQAGTASV